MEVTLGLLGTGSAGGPSSGGSTTGSVSTVSMDDNLVLSSEVSSSYPDESELELGLGLNCGGGAALMSKSVSNPAPWGQYARILTGEYFLSSVAKSSSSSSPSSYVTRANASAGTKRTADSVAAASNAVSQVVGWPPIRAHRMNCLVNQIKSPATEEFNSTFEEGKSRNGEANMTNNVSDLNIDNAKEKRYIKTSLFVKVNMDGIPIGRKVDLNAQSCYETLAQTLEDMFSGPTTTSIIARRSSIEEHGQMTDATGHSKLLDGSSEYVLTYEDKEGDWMLVGDVPWGMFLSSVKRLRIMRTSEANGLAPRFQGTNGSQK